MDASISEASCQSGPCGASSSQEALYLQLLAYYSDSNDNQDSHGFDLHFYQVFGSQARNESGEHFSLKAGVATETAFEKTPKIKLSSSSIVIFDEVGSAPLDTRSYISTLIYVYNSLLKSKDKNEGDLQLIIPDCCKALIPLISAIFGFKLRRGNFFILSKNTELCSVPLRSVFRPSHSFLYKNSSFYIWEINSYNNSNNSNIGSEGSVNTSAAASLPSALLWLHIDRFGHSFIFETEHVSDNIINKFRFPTEEILEAFLSSMQVCATSSISRSGLEIIIPFLFDLLIESKSKTVLPLFVPNVSVEESIITDVIRLSGFNVSCVPNLNLLYLKNRSIVESIDEIRQTLYSEDSFKNLEVYLLAGQSNMAGRGKPQQETCSSQRQMHVLFDNSGIIQPNKLPLGSANPDGEGLQTFISDERSRSPSAYVYSTGGGGGSGDSDRLRSFGGDVLGQYYDPIGAWGPISSSSLHKNVDICKTAGYGPGNSFSDSYSSASCKDPNNLGLISASAGGSKLDEWTANFDSGIVDRTGLLIPNRNCTYHMFRGASSSDHRADYNSYNLMSSCLRSVFKSLSYICHNRLRSNNGQTIEPARISGMLWYQGESDLTPELASNYFDRLQCFFVDISNYISVLEIFAHVFSYTIFIADSSKDGEGIDEANFKLSMERNGSISLDFKYDENDLSCLSVVLPQELRICQVGITTSRFDLKNHLITWREGLKDFLFKTYKNEPQSQNIERSVRYFRNLYLTFVDAIGLPLQDDCIHLNSLAYLLLGDLMHVGIRSLRSIGNDKDAVRRAFVSVNKGYGIQYLHFETNNMERNFEHFSRRNSRDKYAEYLVNLYRKARGAFNFRSKQETEEGLVYDTGRIPSVDGKYVYDSSLADPREEIDSNQATKKFSCSNIRQSGLKPKNFVYGEISIESYVTILSMAYSLCNCNRTLDVWKVVDLGCGSGVALSAAILLKFLLLDVVSGETGQAQAPYFEVMGIDLMKSKVEECIETNKLFLDQLVNMNSATSNNTISTTISSSSIASGIGVAQDASLTSRLSSILRVVVLEDNFLSVSDKWIDSNLVIICATCFQPDVLHPIYSKLCQSLKQGGIVVVVDQTHLHDDSWLTGCSSSSSSDTISNSNTCTDKSYKPFFKLVSSCEATSSWGVGCVYFYEKIT